MQVQISPFKPYSAVGVASGMQPLPWSVVGDDKGECHLEMSLSPQPL